jgi:cell division protein FtsQ
MGHQPDAGPDAPASAGPAGRAGPVSAAGSASTAGPATAAGSASTAGPATAVGSAAEPAAAKPPGTPPAPLAPRRHADPWKAAFFVVAIVAIIAGVGWALLGSKFLVVRSIEVNGAPAISRAQVIAASGVKAGTPLIRVDTSSVARRVEQITLVQSARVRRAWPDGLVITLQQRQAVLAITAGSQYRLIDKFGVVLRQVAQPPAGMPVLTTPGTAQPASLRGSPAVAAAAAVLRDLPTALSRSVKGIGAATADSVTLHLRDGITIVWGDAGQTLVKAREVTILMRGHARYFDVSDPRAVVTGR